MQNLHQTILLHSCCGPCSTTALERLCQTYRVTVFYYNPNILPESEYAHRLAEQERLIKMLQEAGTPVDLIAGAYEPNVYLEAVKGLENEPEGGARCAKCFELRLRKTACVALQKGISTFCTTLTVSPHKNAEVINRIGITLAADFPSLTYLPTNFKKQEGYKRSLELSRQYNIYRQNYCGCPFAMEHLSKLP